MNDITTTETVEETQDTENKKPTKSKAKLTTMDTVEAVNDRKPKETVNAGNGVTIVRY